MVEWNDRVRSAVSCGFSVLLGICLFALVVSASAGERALLDLSSGLPEGGVKANGVEVKTVSNGKENVLQVTCVPSGNAYPGVEITPYPQGTWALNAYGRVEALVTNLGDRPLTITVRIDNPGDWADSPWNAEAVTIDAGATAAVPVYFGFSWGSPGFGLNPAKISKVMVFTGKVDTEIKYRIEAIRAAGTPADRPGGRIARATKTNPEDGVLFSAQHAVSHLRLQPDLATRAEFSAGQGLRMWFSGDSARKYPGVTVKPPEGTIWDLCRYSQVDFTVRNAGEQPLQVFCRVDNEYADGNIHCVSGNATIGGGESGTVTVSFVTKNVWDGNRKNSGTVFASDSVRGFTVFAVQQGVEAELLLMDVQAKLGECFLPSWSGKRPPTDGAWEMTFEDTFEGTQIDKQKWQLPADDLTDSDENCGREQASIWDKLSINTEKNAIVSNGHLRMRVTKSAGAGRTDSPQKKRRYCSTAVTSFNRFAQKYGYFEARMKLPSARGLRPAFWLMPDRGRAAGIWWKRMNTADGGMEFDIMEHLVRFGPCRYNICMHWDGYEIEHKSIGTEEVYFLPDREGYVTSGLLWEPGKATFYCQGKIVCLWENTRISSVPAYILFTQPLGGWGGDGLIDDAQLPDDFVIDYVRVWQREDFRGK